MVIRAPSTWFKPPISGPNVSAGNVGETPLDLHLTPAGDALDPPLKFSLAQRMRQRFEMSHPGSSRDIGWAAELAPRGANRTPEFQSLYARAHQGESVLPADAQKYRYLLVRGLLADRMKFYMKGTERALGSHGLDVVLTQTNTTAPLAENLKVLRALVLEAAAEGKQVVLIGHSKGANEAVSLSSVYPELVPHIRGVVSLEAAFGGAVLASDLTRGPVTSRIIDWLQRKLGAAPDSAYELSHASRRAFVAQYPVSQEVPMMALSAHCLSPRSLTFLIALYSRLRYGRLGRSDGMIAERDQEIPGKPRVRLTAFDHAGPSFPDWASPGRWRSGKVSETLVAMVLADAARVPGGKGPARMSTGA